MQEMAMEAVVIGHDGGNPEVRTQLLLELELTLPPAESRKLLKDAEDDYTRHRLTEQAAAAA